MDQLVSKINLRTSDIKNACNLIFQAIDTSSFSSLSDILSIKVKENKLILSVTNKEYFISFKVPFDEDINFNVTISAKVFLKLISSISDEVIEFSINENTLIVSSKDSNYKIPIIYDGDKILELPTININNVTSNFKIDGNILDSIYNFNNMQILVDKDRVTNPTQKCFYVDDEGCITFTSGASVNNFKLPSKIGILLNSKIVKLFKFFKDKEVDFKLGFDEIDSNIISKVSFYSNDVELTAILQYSNDEILKSIPITQIRDRSTKNYSNTIVIDTNNLIEAINRLSIFNETEYIFKCKFKFFDEYLQIIDENNSNSEIIYYNNSKLDIKNTYETYLDINYLRVMLSYYKNKSINISFGDKEAITIAYTNLVNIIPEINE